MIFSPIDWCTEKSRFLVPKWDVEVISTKNTFFFCIDYSKVKASRIEGNLLKNSQKSLKEGLIEKRLICQLALHTQKDFL